MFAPMQAPGAVQSIVHGSSMGQETLSAVVHAPSHTISHSKAISGGPQAAIISIV
jgi:hypothetical protein